MSTQAPSHVTSKALFITLHPALSSPFPPLHSMESGGRDRGWSP